MNGTFYSLKSRDVFRRWVSEVLPGFLFAVKGSRFITHNLKLRNAEAALANFYASGVLALGRMTGPFLWQLPATYRFERERIASFLALLPRDSIAAAKLARGHDNRLRRGALTATDSRIRYRHAGAPSVVCTAHVSSTRATTPTTSSPCGRSASNDGLARD